MMGKFKKAVSVFASAAVAASMFSALTLSAAAKTAVVSENFNDSTTIGSYWKGSGNAGTSTSDGYLAITGATGGGRNREITLEANTGNAEYAELDFDFNSSNDGGANYLDHSLYMRDSSGNNIMTFTFPNTHYSAGKVQLNGTNVNIDAPKAGYTGWYSVKSVLKFNTHTFDYTITLQGSSVVVASDSDVPMQTEATNMGKIYFAINRTAQAIKLDNFYLATLTGPSITLGSAQMVIPKNNTDTIATVTDAATIVATSSDESAIKTSVSGNLVKAEYVAEGKSTVTITATSADGVKTKKTITVIAGNPEFANVTVRYIDSDNNEIAAGYILSDQVVGSTISASSVNYDAVISGDEYRYSNPSVSDHTVVNGLNVINVKYANKTAAVKSITVNYVSGETTVVSKNVDISSSKLYVGDPYSYYSTAYVKDADGVIYTVGEDYKTDGSITIAALTSDNSKIYKTVTLDSTATVKYDVTKTTDAVLYSEWEDLIENAGMRTFGSDKRYYASGGESTKGTSTPIEFYRAEAAGYYQIIITGTEAQKRTLSVYNGDTEVISFSFDKNSDYYGLRVVKTLYLENGDILKTKGTTPDLDYVVVKHITTGEVSGLDGISVISGGQTAKYSFSSAIDSITDESPVWSVSGVTGVTIDQDGVLNVPANAGTGTAAVTATLPTAGVTATKNVTIAAPEIASVSFSGPELVSGGSSNAYSVALIKDQFGVDVSSVATVSFSSSDSNVISIDQSTGIATAKSAGTVDVTATVTVGTDSKPFTKNVTVSNVKYYLTGTTADVDTSNIATSRNITGYRITTAKDGAIVKQYDAAAIPSTVDMTGADSWEIDPIYTYSLGAMFNYTPSDDFADGYYDMSFTKANNQRIDIYVNGYMVGNNVDQSGWGRNNQGGTVHSINDVVVTGRKIALSTADNAYNKSTGISAMTVVKAPSNVARKHKVYVIGDSLVANYYGTYASEVGNAQTGWGQQLSNFVSDDWEVVNFANSGNWAAGLQTDAHPGVMAMIQPGDWYVIESGYNDFNYPKDAQESERRAIMYNAVKEMTEEAEAKGAHVVLVSPNASTNPFSSNVRNGAKMSDVYNDLKDIYGNMLTYINLSKLSYDFMVSTGISTKYTDGGVLVQAKFNGERFESAKTSEVAAGGFVPAANITADKYFVWDALSGIEALNKAKTESSTEQIRLTYNENQDVSHSTSEKPDGLHSSYAGAMKWAEIVAQGMKDAGAGFINTDFSYTFTDTIGNNITCQVK